MDLAPAVSAVRAFNRGYAKVIGVLDESMVNGAYTLAEARVLFELAHHQGEGGAQAARIRDDLGLDAGYLSRILGRFEAEGLVVRGRSSQDARRATVALTERGLAVFSGLDDRTGEGIAALLARLSLADRTRVVEAMAQVGTLLDLERATHQGPVTLRAPRPGDYGWVVERHGTLYAKEYDWDETMEGHVAGIVSAYLAAHDLEREAFWIAEAGGQRAGSIACVRKATDDGVETAQLRLLIVDPAVRGLGVGRRLVAECVAFARAAGYRRIVLCTVDILHSARRVYEAAGFELIAQWASHVYGHDLVEQDWSLELELA